jgi:hypothetical protein
MSFDQLRALSTPAEYALDAEEGIGMKKQKSKTEKQDTTEEVESDKKIILTPAQVRAHMKMLWEAEPLLLDLLFG